MKNLPQARSHNIVVQTLGKETLVYDLLTHRAFNLNETSSIVFNACDGITEFTALKKKYKFTDDLIFLAIDELKRENLLDDVSYNSPFAGVSRREVIKKVGLATMIALPLISGLVAPTAAQAASGTAAAAACSPLSSSDLGESCDNFGNYGRKADGCYCQSGFCVATNSGDACCISQSGSQIKPGTTFSTDAPYYVLIGPNATAPTCADSDFKCCDGSQPYGSCSYVSQTPYEGSDPQLQGYSLAGVSCNCSCP